MARNAGQERRVTIADIAERAGVSKGAVSYALNGQPGVSDATRERIIAIAAELGWYPNRAARALSASRADACGLVIASLLLGSVAEGMVRKATVPTLIVPAAPE